MPAEKMEGAYVVAGLINQMGAIEIMVERVGRDTSYGRIVEAVESAERRALRCSGSRIGSPAIWSISPSPRPPSPLLVTRDVRDTISVVIVAGACGIAAGTPLAILGAIGRAARMGAIVKGGMHLETSSTPTPRARRAASSTASPRPRCASTGRACAVRRARAEPVTQVSDAEADAYFASRPKLSRIGAWASKQSRPLESRFALEKAAAQFGVKYALGEVPDPPALLVGLPPGACRNGILVRPAFPPP